MVAVGIPGATPFGGHAGPVYCVAFSPDGTAFATGGGDGVVRLWDTATKAQTRQLVGHTDAVRAVAWSPDGTSIVSGGIDHTVRVWDVASSQQVWQLSGHRHTVRTVAWSPDGTAVASGAHSVRVWDVGTGRQTRKFTGHDHRVRALAWHPRGDVIASGAGTVRIWDARTGEQLSQVTGYDVPVRSVAWSPDGTVLATGAGKVRFWNTVIVPVERAVLESVSRPLRQITEASGNVQAVAWSPDGTVIAVGDGPLVRLWDAATGRPTREFAGHADEVAAIAWHPDGTTIASADGRDGTVRLWDTGSPAGHARLTGHTGQIFSVAWSPDGTTIATSSEEHTVRLWDAATGTQTNQLTGHTGWVRAAAWSPDGTTIATASDDHTVRLWDSATGTQKTQLTGHADWVLAVTWSPDGTTIATASEDGTVALWDSTTGTGTTQLTGHAIWVAAVAWSPDGTTIATASDDHTVRLWDSATGTQKTQLTGHTSPVAAVAWSPDGTTIATASDDHTACLWDSATSSRKARLTGHTGPVEGVSWSPDGTTIATASADGTTRLWDAITGTQKTQLTGHTSVVAGVAWSPDGSTVATVGADGTIRIWNPRNGAQVNGTGFGVARAAPRALAGVGSDSPSAVDRLGVGADVETLAELIAATETTPPLAIALIGDWGAGKSSVMLQVESHVRELATKAKNNPGLSAFAENVRQVRFNAWHYSDDHLWAGLVSHLFEGLARPDNPEAGQDQPAAPSAQAEIDRVRSALDAKQQQLAAKKRDANSRVEKLRNADEAARPTGLLEWLGSPAYAGRVLVAAAEQALHDVRDGLFAVLIWVVLGAAAYAAWRFAGALAGSVSATVAVLAAPAVAVLRNLRAAHSQVLALVDQEHGKLVASQQKVQQEVRDTEREIQELKDRLVLVDAAEGLARFLDDRADGTTYREYRGLLGQVRADLDQLSASLDKARQQWTRGGRFGPPPLERIVLYIDDLDRCPPKRVVEVLEAVHLMLALDLFVVVVAVDARWLIRSLEHHHRELFRSGDGHRETTPLNYLDKIFQIPFTLLPPGPDATADYLRSLLPQSVPQSADYGRRATATGRGQSATSPDDPPAVMPEGDQSGTPEADLVDDIDAMDRDEPARPDWRGRTRGNRNGDTTSGPRRPGRAEADTAELGVIELRPLGLQVSQVEVAFMARLGGLLPTPRVAKRLVNLYRLVRIGVPNAELAGFVGDETGGPYQTVQVLLAILVGHPEFAWEVFRAILGDPDPDPEPEPDSAEEAYPDLIAAVEAVGTRPGKAPAFRAVLPSLLEIREEAPRSVDMDECRRWCPQLARFSFYTPDLAGLSRPTGSASFDSAV